MVQCTREYIGEIQPSTMTALRANYSVHYVLMYGPHYKACLVQANRIISIMSVGRQTCLELYFSVGTYSVATGVPSSHVAVPQTDGVTRADETSDSGRELDILSSATAVSAGLSE